MATCSSLNPHCGHGLESVDWPRHGQGKPSRLPSWGVTVQLSQAEGSAGVSPVQMLVAAWSCSPLGSWPCFLQCPPCCTPSQGALLTRALENSMLSLPVSLLLGALGTELWQMVTFVVSLLPNLKARWVLFMSLKRRVYCLSYFDQFMDLRWICTCDLVVTILSYAYWFRGLWKVTGRPGRNRTLPVQW